MRRAGASSRSAVLHEIERRLDSLTDRCAGGLAAGIEAMARGDLTHVVTSGPTPVGRRSKDAAIDGIADRVDALDRTLHAAVAGYEALRGELARVLGERSSLAQVQSRLDSLTDDCLTGLTVGLGRMAEGDLTFAVASVTAPVTTEAGLELGSLATSLNTTLDRCGARSTTTTACAASSAW